MLQSKLHAPQKLEIDQAVPHSGSSFPSLINVQTGAVTGKSDAG